MANQRDNFAIGMNMTDEIYDCLIPVFIRQDRSDNFVTNMRETDKNKEFGYYRYDSEPEIRNGRYANIYPFGMNDTGYSSDERMLKRAKLINYLYSTMDKSNSFQSLRVLNSVLAARIWHDAEEKWCRLDVAHKWSNLYCAYTITLQTGFTACNVRSETRRQLRHATIVRHREQHDGGGRAQPLEYGKTADGIP